MSFASPARRPLAPIGNGNVLLNKYLKMMGEIPLLTREDEVEVARRIDMAVACGRAERTHSVRYEPLL